MRDNALEAKIHRDLSSRLCTGGGRANYRLRESEGLRFGLLGTVPELLPNTDLAAKAAAPASRVHQCESVNPCSIEQRAGELPGAPGGAKRWTCDPL